MTIRKRIGAKLTGRTYVRSHWLTVFLILVATIVVIFVFARKTFFKQKTVYSDFDSSKDLDQMEKEEEQVKQKDSEEDKEEERDSKDNGKWAFKD